MFQYSSKPESIGRVLDASIKLFFASFTKVFIFILLFSLIILSPHFFMSNAMLAPGASDPDPDFLWKFLPAAFVAGVFAAAFYIAIYYRMDKIARREEADASSAIAVGFKKLVPVVVAGILYMIAFVVGSVLLVVPGIILLLSLYFYMPLVISDNMGPVRSLLTSHRLVWGNWWRTATVFLVPFFLMIVLLVLVGVIMAVFVGVGAASGTEETSATVNTIYSIVMLVFYIVMYPYIASITLVQLNDLKLRKQGADLEARVEAG